MSTIPLIRSYLGKSAISITTGSVTTSNVNIIGNTSNVSTSSSLIVQGNVLISGNLTVSGSNIVNNQIVNNIEYNSSNVIINNLSGLGPALKVSQKGVGANYPIADFYDNDVSTTIPALRIADGGNVGIGTATPLQTLHVVGNILSTGSIDVGTQFLGLSTDLVTTPSYSWDGDLNTGMYRPAADMIGLVTGGVERLRVIASGNVGIGTTNPQDTLHIIGNILITGRLRQSGEIKVVHRRPLFIRNISGGQVYNLTSTPLTINSMIYGVYVYAVDQVPVASGAVRYFRVYAVYSDGITNGYNWYIRIVSNVNNSLYNDYALGPTYGGVSGETRDYYSNYSVNNINASHGFMQIWVPSGAAGGGTINISFIELQALDVYQ